VDFFAKFVFHGEKFPQFSRIARMSRGSGYTNTPFFHHLAMPSSRQHTPWRVLKFGGTSVSQRQRWDTIGALARGRTDGGQRRVLLVVSALSGITNELTAMADGAEDARTRMQAVIARHLEFAHDLGLPDFTALHARLDQLRALLDDPRAPSRALDWQAELLAHGELLSSTLGAAYLRSLDCKNCAYPSSK